MVFWLFAFAGRVIWAVGILVGVSGYLLMSYRYYFHGGWEAAGQAHPFNEELIFSLLLLSALALAAGFLVWIREHRRTADRLLSRSRLMGFGQAYLLFAVVAGVVILAVPLSFDMPINLQLCDGSVGQPGYCP